jgi:hypothetical protein
MTWQHAHRGVTGLPSCGPLGTFGQWGFLGKNAQNLPGGIHQTKGVRFLAGMAPGDIMCPQLGGRNRLGRAWRDRGFRLDYNASLEPNDREQFGLLSVKERQVPQIERNAPARYSIADAFHRSRKAPLGAGQVLSVLPDMPFDPEPYVP